MNFINFTNFMNFINFIKKINFIIKTVTICFTFDVEKSYGYYWIAAIILFLKMFLLVPIANVKQRIWHEMFVFFKFFTNFINFLNLINFINVRKDLYCDFGNF